MVDLHGEVSLRGASDGATEQASCAARHVGMVGRKVFDVTRSEEQHSTGRRRLDPGLLSSQGTRELVSKGGVFLLKQLLSRPARPAGIQSVFSVLEVKSGSDLPRESSLGRIP